MKQKTTASLKAFKDEQSKKWGFKNANGEIVVAPSYQNAYFQFDEGLCPVTNDEKKVGFVDENGKLVIPCKYVHALSFRDGLALVQEEGTFKIGYINHQGELAIPFMYRKGGDFINGFAMISDDSGDWGAIDHNNKQVCPIIYGWEELYDMLYKNK